MRRSPQFPSSDAKGFPVLSHRAALPLSCQALACVTGVIRRDLAAIGSGWRKLPPVCSIHSSLIRIDRVAADRPSTRESTRSTA